MSFDFLDYTKQKQKQNLDFLSQFMKSHQIDVETIVSPQQSIGTSQMTDQVIKIVNPKLTSQPSPTSNTPLQSPKLVDTAPIIQEIDSILEKIQMKTQIPQKMTPEKKKSPIKIEQPIEEDIAKQIRNKIPLQVKKQKEENIQTIQAIQTIQTIQTNPSQKLETVESKVNLEPSPKKDSSIKEEVKRLRETFKPPKKIDIQPQKEELITTSQFPQQIEEDSSLEYVTPIKRIEGYSQLSYSQSNSILHSDIKETAQKTNLLKDPILEELMQEELMLMQRLQLLQQQLQYEKRHHEFQ